MESQEQQRSQLLSPPPRPPPAVDTTLDVSTGSTTISTTRRLMTAQTLSSRAKRRLRLSALRKSGLAWGAEIESSGSSSDDGGSNSDVFVYDDSTNDTHHHHIHADGYHFGPQDGRHYHHHHHQQQLQLYGHQQPHGRQDFYSSSRIDGCGGDPPFMESLGGERYDNFNQPSPERSILSPVGVQYHDVSQPSTTRRTRRQQHLYAFGGGAPPPPQQETQQSPTSNLSSPSDHDNSTYPGDSSTILFNPLDFDDRFDRMAYHPPEELPQQQQHQQHQQHQLQQLDDHRIISEPPIHHGINNNNERRGGEPFLNNNQRQPYYYNHFGTGEEEQQQQRFITATRHASFDDFSYNNTNNSRNRSRRLKRNSLFSPHPYEFQEPTNDVAYYYSNLREEEEGGAFEDDGEERPSLVDCNDPAIMNGTRSSFFFPRQQHHPQDQQPWMPHDQQYPGEEEMPSSFVLPELNDDDPDFHSRNHITNSSSIALERRCASDLGLCPMPPTERFTSTEAEAGLPAIPGLNTPAVLPPPPPLVPPVRSSNNNSSSTMQPTPFLPRHEAPHRGGRRRMMMDRSASSSNVMYNNSNNYNSGYPSPHAQSMRSVSFTTGTPNRAAPPGLLPPPSQQRLRSISSVGSGIGPMTVTDVTPTRFSLSALPGAAALLRAPSVSMAAERPIEEIIPTFEDLHFSLLRHTLRRDVAPDEILCREDCLAVMNAKQHNQPPPPEADDVNEERWNNNNNSDDNNNNGSHNQGGRRFLCEMHVSASEQLQLLNEEMASKGHTVLEQLQEEAKKRGKQLTSSSSTKKPIMKISHKLTGKLRSGVHNKKLLEGALGNNNHNNNNSNNRDNTIDDDVDLMTMALPTITKNEISLEDTFSTCSPRNRDRSAPAVYAKVETKETKDSPKDASAAFSKGFGGNRGQLHSIVESSVTPKVGGGGGDNNSCRQQIQQQQQHQHNDGCSVTVSSVCTGTTGGTIESSKQRSIDSRISKSPERSSSTGTTKIQNTATSKIAPTGTATTKETMPKLSDVNVVVHVPKKRQSSATMLTTQNQFKMDRALNRSTTEGLQYFPCAPSLPLEIIAKDKRSKWNTRNGTTSTRRSTGDITTNSDCGGVLSFGPLSEGFKRNKNDTEGAASPSSTSNTEDAASPSSKPNTEDAASPSSRSNALSEETGDQSIQQGGEKTKDALDLIRVATSVESEETTSLHWKSSSSTGSALVQVTTSSVAMISGLDYSLSTTGLDVQGGRSKGDIDKEEGDDDDDNSVKHNKRKSVFADDDDNDGDSDGNNDNDGEQSSALEASEKDLIEASRFVEYVSSSTSSANLSFTKKDSSDNYGSLTISAALLGRKDEGNASEAVVESKHDDDYIMNSRTGDSSSYSIQLDLSLVGDDISQLQKSFTSMIDEAASVVADATAATGSRDEELGADSNASKSFADQPLSEELLRAVERKPLKKTHEKSSSHMDQSTSSCIESTPPSVSSEVAECGEFVAEDEQDSNAHNPSSKVQPPSKDSAATSLQKALKEALHDKVENQVEEPVAGSSTTRLDPLNDNSEVHTSGAKDSQPRVHNTTPECCPSVGTSEEEKTTEILKNSRLVKARSQLATTNTAETAPMDDSLDFRVQEKANKTTSSLISKSINSSNNSGGGHNSNYLAFSMDCPDPSFSQEVEVSHRNTTGEDDKEHAEELVPLQSSGSTMSGEATSGDDLDDSPPPPPALSSTPVGSSNATGSFTYGSSNTGDQVSYSSGSSSCCSDSDSSYSQGKSSDFDDFDDNDENFVARRKSSEGVIFQEAQSPVTRSSSVRMSVTMPSPEPTRRSLVVVPNVPATAAGLITPRTKAVGSALYLDRLTDLLVNGNTNDSDMKSHLRHTMSTRGLLSAAKQHASFYGDQRTLDILKLHSHGSSHKEQASDFPYNKYDPLDDIPDPVGILDGTLSSSSDEDSQGMPLRIPHVSEHLTPSRLKRRRPLKGIGSYKDDAASSKDEAASAQENPSTKDNQVEGQEPSTATADSGVRNKPPKVPYKHLVRRRMLLPDLSEMLSGADLTDITFLDNFMYCSNANTGSIDNSNSRVEMSDSNVSQTYYNNDENDSCSDEEERMDHVASFTHWRHASPSSKTTTDDKRNLQVNTDLPYKTGVDKETCMSELSDENEEEKKFEVTLDNEKIEIGSEKGLSPLKSPPNSPQKSAQNSPQKSPQNSPQKSPQRKTALSPGASSRSADMPVSSPKKGNVSIGSSDVINISSNNDDLDLSQHPFAHPETEERVAETTTRDSKGLSRFCDFTPAAMREGAGERDTEEFDIVDTCNSFSHAVEIAFGLFPAEGTTEGKNDGNNDATDDGSGRSGKSMRRTSSRIRSKNSTNKNGQRTGWGIRSALKQCWNDVHEVNTAGCDIKNANPCGPSDIYRQASARNKCQVNGKLYTPPSLRLRTDSALNEIHEVGSVRSTNVWADNLRRRQSQLSVGSNHGYHQPSPRNMSHHSRPPLDPRWEMAMGGSSTPLRLDGRPSLAPGGMGAKSARNFADPRYSFRIPDERDRKDRYPNAAHDTANTAEGLRGRDNRPWGPPPPPPPPRQASFIINGRSERHLEGTQHAV